MTSIGGHDDGHYDRDHACRCRHCQSRRGAVFDRLGLDYCCHGTRSIVEASKAAGLDPDLVTSELAVLDAGDTEWATLDPAALAEHIVEQHHRYLHEELPLLDALAAKVLSVHGERHPELAEVRRLVAALREDLDPHLMKEERILFPAIAALAAGQTEFPFGSIANPIRMMTLEHDGAGELLESLRSATGDYTAPADACASYQSLYQRLADIEADTHLHVHKENHVLFPAALRMAGAAED
ncbi:MAG: iron-sulfur cluster repair di-iron protein [Microthrixaceae bacterium]